MQDVATEAQRKYANDPILKFFCAFGMMLEGKTKLCLRSCKQKFKLSVGVSLFDQSVEWLLC